MVYLKDIETWLASILDYFGIFRRTDLKMILKRTILAQHSMLYLLRAEPDRRGRGAVVGKHPVACCSSVAAVNGECRRETRGHCRALSPAVYFFSFELLYRLSIG